MSKQKTPVGEIARFINTEIPKQVKDAVSAIPKPVDGLNGVGVEADVWVKGVYRKNSVVTHYIGQYFKSIRDTSDEPGSQSKDWERIGLSGFCMRGPFDSDTKYTNGDFYVKDFGLFLFINEKSFLIAGRGQVGKRGEVGAIGKSGADGKSGVDGSDIVSFDVNETNLIMVIKDGGGKLKKYSVDLSPLLEASIEVARSFGDQTLDKVPGVVKSLLDALYVHPIDEKATPVRFFRGSWHTSTKYKTGDIVVFGEVLLVAKENNKGELPIGNLQNPLGTNKSWRIMASFESKGIGGGGGVVGGAIVPGVAGSITGDMVTINIDPVNPVNLNEMIAAIGTMFEDLKLERFITHGYVVPIDTEGKDGDEFFLQSYGDITWDLTSAEANAGKSNYAIGYSIVTPVTATYGTLTLTGVAHGYILAELYRSPSAKEPTLRCVVYGPINANSPLIKINGISLGEVVDYVPDVVVSGAHVSSHTYILKSTHKVVSLIVDGAKVEVRLYPTPDGATHPFARFEKRNGHWQEILTLLADGSVLLEEGYLPEHNRSVADKVYVDSSLDKRIFIYKGSTAPVPADGVDGDLYYKYNIPSHTSDLLNVSHIDKAASAPTGLVKPGTVLLKVSEDGVLRGKSGAPILRITLKGGIKVNVGTITDLNDGSSDIYLYFYPETDSKANWDEVLKLNQITLGTTDIPLFSHFTYGSKTDAIAPVVFKVPNFNLIMGAFITATLPVRLAQTTGSAGRVGQYDIFEKVSGVWIARKAILSDGTVSMESWYYPTEDSDVASKLYVDDELKIQADRLDPPIAERKVLRQFTYDPEIKKSRWYDARERIGVVPDIASLSDRAVLPLSHIVEGKLVYVTSEHTIYELLTNNAAMTNTAKDWGALGGGGASVSFVSRFMNLPDPNKTPPESGSVFIIELDFEGDPYQRMVIWDDNIKGEPDTVRVKCKPFAAANAIATNAELTIAFKSSTAVAFAGQWYVITAPAGLDPLKGEPYAGIHFDMGTKLINLGGIHRGVSGWIIAPPDAGFADIATTPPTMPIDQIVDDTGIPVKTGGWRFINRMNWVHALSTDLDHTIDNQIGDFQTTIEKDNHGLKVFTGSGWVNLFSEDEIREWIAAMSLFQGTVDLPDDPAAKPTPFVHAIGSTQLTRLPDLAALTLAKDATQSSHYWTWVGEINHVVKVTDPSIGVDLAGATLNPGDWIQIANKGTSTVPDLAWTHIGGDLLTKRRADSLYGLTTWTNGNYEEHSLVNYKGDAYRALAGVIAGDSAPDTLVTAVIPKINAVKHVTANAVITITDSISMKQLMVTAPKPAQWISYSITASFTAAATLTGFDGTLMAQNRAVIWTGFPSLEYAAANFIVHKGWLYIDNATPADVAVRAPFNAAMKAVAVVNKWEKVPLGGGIKTVPTDSDLPKMGMTKDTYLILVSQKHANKPVIVTWDQAQRKWMLVGSGGNLELVITGGNLTYPKNYVTAANVAMPVQCGRFPGDLLIAQDKPNAQYYPKSTFNVANTEVAIGAHLLTTGRPGAIPTIPGQRGDVVVTQADAVSPLCTYVSDGTHWINQSAGGIFHHTRETIEGYAWNDHAWHAYTNKTVRIPASLINRWVKISLTLYHASDNNNTGILRVIFDNHEHASQNVHATGDTREDRNAEFIFTKQVRSADIAAGLRLAVTYSWHGGGAVLIRGYRIIAEDMGCITA